MAGESHGGAGQALRIVQEARAAGMDTRDFTDLENEQDGYQWGRRGCRAIEEQAQEAQRVTAELYEGTCVRLSKVKSAMGLKTDLFVP